MYLASGKLELRYWNVRWLVKTWNLDLILLWRMLYYNLQLFSVCFAARSCILNSFLNFIFIKCSFRFRLGFYSLVCIVIYRVWEHNVNVYCMHLEVLLRMDCLCVVIVSSSFCKQTSPKTQVSCPNQTMEAISLTPGKSSANDTTGNGHPIDPRAALPSISDSYRPSVIREIEGKTKLKDNTYWGLRN